MGFTAMEVNQSLYIFCSRETSISICIHVDNAFILSNSLAVVSYFKHWLCMEVDIKWNDVISQIVRLECAFGKGEVAIVQRRLTNSILDTYPWQIAKHDSALPVLPMANSTVKEKILDPTPFCSVIGSLAYLVRSSWPDLAFAVNYLSQQRDTGIYWIM
ncbi:hypothetical protein O181_110910 [Austropuccinia psidii MF-1]|uniref:Reverse transcriptase Ty1/copia-type domain-containing protein n=1 Tax=Austropuccinia psidii MF-1 TaxID=1389203 RepID=A0A9Q3K1E1_9BASI|nr:hypothetical protein [Austropuccinia psidii MF-1]